MIHARDFLSWNKYFDHPSAHGRRDRLDVGPRAGVLRRRMKSSATGEGRMSSAGWRGRRTRQSAFGPSGALRSEKVSIWAVALLLFAIGFLVASVTLLVAMPR